MTAVNRREFLKLSAGVAAWLLAPRYLRGIAPAPPRVVVVHGKEIPAMLEAGLNALGGWKSFVPPNGKVTLKPNAAWAATPGEGANTHPALVEACIHACRAAGAAQVVLPENPCSPAEKAFRMSGIADAARRGGARLYQPAGNEYQLVEIPRGKSLRQVKVANDVVSTDCLINLPVAKTHGSAQLTIGLKNWMGSVLDRGWWHRHNLHQCIADFSTRIRAHLTIVDALRIMVANGPRGPGPLEHPNQLIFGTDPVAVDAYAATLFSKDPLSIPHLQIAHEMGLGCGDIKQLDIVHLRL